MNQAIWKGVVIAESDKTLVVEGNYYFPPESIKKEYFRTNKAHTVCPWKGVASYYDVVVDGDVSTKAAWYYPDPNLSAKNIKDYVAFWGGVKIIKAQHFVVFEFGICGVVIAILAVIGDRKL